MTRPGEEIDAGACTSPEMSRLEYAPHRVYQRVEGGGLEPDGLSEMIDGTWKQTDSFWCHGCDTKLDGEEAALDHVGAAEARGAA